MTEEPVATIKLVQYTYNGHPRYKAVVHDGGDGYEGHSLFQDQAIANAMERWNEAKHSRTLGVCVA